MSQPRENFNKILENFSGAKTVIDGTFCGGEIIKFMLLYETAINFDFLQVNLPIWPLAIRD